MTSRIDAVVDEALAKLATLDEITPEAAMAAARPAYMTGYLDAHEDLSPDKTQGHPHSQTERAGSPDSEGA